MAYDSIGDGIKYETRISTNDHQSAGLRETFIPFDNQAQDSNNRKPTV